MTPVVPGPTNTLTDVAGLRVGHTTRTEPGWLTGTTVVLAPPGGAVAGVDVRGGGPGTRETDLLDPLNLVDRVHAVLLTGGSAPGLASADGVVQGLFDDGVGFPMGGPGQVVPIVPGAVVFDLGRGGEFANWPRAAEGTAAYRAAKDDQGAGPVDQGTVGAGTGARSGGIKGGIGSASAVLPDGTTVAALMVVNSLGSTVHPTTGRFHGEPWLLPGDVEDLIGPPSEAELSAARERAAAQEPGPVGRPAMATTIGVVATDATLTKAQCAKLAGLAHDGLARAISPVHTMLDGDTVFALATGTRAPSDLAGMHTLLEHAAHVSTRATVRAITSCGVFSLNENGSRDGAGGMNSYRTLFPSAFRD